MIRLHALLVPSGYLPVWHYPVRIVPIRFYVGPPLDPTSPSSGCPSTKLESPDKMSRPDKVQQIALFVTRFYPTTHGRVVEAMANQTNQELKLLLSVPGEFSRKFSTSHVSSWNRFEFNPPILVKVWDNLPKATSTENVTKGSPKSPPEGKIYVTILGLPMALVTD